MKTKTLKQINHQTSEIMCSIVRMKITDIEKMNRMHRVKKIAARYRANALEYLRDKLSPIELDEYFAVTEVPASIYTK